MRRFSRAAIGAVVALVLLGALPGTTLAAQPTCGQVLMANTTLTADLDCSTYAGSALFMGNHRVVLNLNGKTIWGWDGDDGYAGVETEGYNHTVIRDGTIENFGTGVDASDSYATKIKRVTITGAADDSDDFGVYANIHVATTVSKANISGATTGIHLEAGASALVTNSTITADGGAAVELRNETNDTVSWNTLGAPGGFGVDADYSAGIHYTGNTATGSGGGTGFQINCHEIGRVFMTDNEATNWSYGFYVIDCFDNASYAPGTGSRFSGNMAIDNGGDGFTVFRLLNSTWTGNEARLNGIDGYYLFGMGGSMLTGNIGSRNGGVGFAINSNDVSSGDNLEDFSDNKAKWNGSNGMRADYGVPGTGNVARYNGSRQCVNVHCN